VIQISKLYDLNVAPTVIRDILKDVNGDDVGTFLPQTLFNRNEKLQELLNMDKLLLVYDPDDNYKEDENDLKYSYLNIENSLYLPIPLFLLLLG
jgi:hypothetical protein